MDEIAKAIAAIRAQGGDEAAVQRYLASIGATEVKQDPATAALQDVNAASHRERTARVRAAQNAADRALGPMDQLGALANSFTDAATFGGAGLLTDMADAALTGRTFSANRQARKMARESLTGGERVGATLAGALANPVGTLVKAPAGAGLLGRTRAGLLDAAAQGGLTGAVENLNSADREGIATAVRGGLLGASTGAATAGVVGGAQGLASGANTLRRVARATNPDVRAFELRDAIAKADAALYGAAGREARNVGTTQEIRSVLASQTVKPFADMVRRSESHGMATDAETLLETYKLMSAAQRKAAKSIEGTPEFLADLELRNRDIGVAKGRMLDAADAPSGNLPPPMPSMRPAVQAHAKAEGEYAAFRDTYDAVRRVLGDKAVAGKKLTLDSPEALRRAIRDMTPEEASLALEATLGATRGTARLSSNPITLFGVIPAAFRMAHAPSQVNPFIALLEKQAGKQPSLFSNPVVSERVRGTAVRTMSGLLSP